MDLKNLSDEFIIDESFLIGQDKLIDFSMILRRALLLNGKHDQLIQKELSLQLLGPQQSWVITQYQIQQFNTPKLGSQLEINTRIIDLNPFFVTRRHQVSQGDTIFYELYTQFAAIDLHKRRIARLSYDKEQVKDIIDANYSVKFVKLSKADFYNLQDSHEIKIQASDIDENQHVNNLVYLRWAYQSLPTEIINKWQFEKIYVKYEKEILPEDHIEIQTGLDRKQHISQQLIYNVSQDSVASLIEIHWKRNEELE